MYFYVYEWLAYMFVCAQCECLVPEEASRGNQSPGTGVTLELPYRCWE